MEQVGTGVTASCWKQQPEKQQVDKQQIITNVKKKTRRGWGTRSNRNKSFSVMGNNVNGLNSKWESFISVLKHFKGPTCVMLQETKLNSKLQNKLIGYQVFQAERKKEGGGILTAVEGSLPALVISEGQGDVEILVVEVTVNNLRIRLINAYGPQETESKNKIADFWSELELEIVKSRNEGCLIIIEMDANAKLGSGVIPKDPNVMSCNGKLMWDVLNRQNLQCLNADPRCSGTITRYRKTIVGEEKAVLDYIVVCEEMYSYFQVMQVDEKRVLTLSKVATSSGKRVKKVSDHNIIFAAFNLRFSRSCKKKRIELFDFKDLDSQRIFHDLTSDSKILRSLAVDPLSPESKSRKFFGEFKNLCYRSFKKIRICDGVSFNIKRQEKHEKLFARKTELLNQIDDMNVKNPSHKAVLELALQNVETQIYNEIAKKNIEVLENNSKMVDSLDGSFNQVGTWKLRKKLFPRTKDPPTAKIDEFGNRITCKMAIRKLYMKTYITRLEHRQIKPEFEGIQKLKEELWDMRYIQLKRLNSRPWTILDLKTVCKELKNNQCRDPNGLISEIFKDEVAGIDLQAAVLSLMNMILENFYIPEDLLKSNITSIWKNKGCRSDLSNDRGIFTLSILRKILDKLLYMKLYPGLEAGMSYSNIGAKKNKNVRDHLFIVYGIVVSVIRESRQCVDLQIYDLVQAFDSLWLKDCMNDLFDILPRNMQDSKLSLVYELNRLNMVTVNTPCGPTDAFSLYDIVQQGGGWGPIECSVSIDKLGRISTKRQQYSYKYKEKVTIVPLAMVDDLLAIAPCGLESLAVNTFINVHIEMKRLKFHTTDKKKVSKCHQIHVGKSNKYCPELKVHGTVMPKASYDSYLGDIVSSDGTNKLNIDNRIAKGRGKLVEIIGSLNKLSFGRHFFRIAMLMRESLFLGSMLTNSEVWYQLTKTEIEEFEVLDRRLLTNVCSLPSSTPSAALYLELGCLTVGTIIKARRLNYLQYLLKLDHKEMLSRFFWCQWLQNRKHDWTSQVRCDLIDFGLTTDLAEIQKKSKLSWKNLVKRKAKEYDFNRLFQKCRSKSKTCRLQYEKLGMQKYLIEASTRDAKTVIKYRLGMGDFSGNYKGDSPVKLCPLCAEHDDVQDLIFQCHVVRNLQMNENVHYDELFGSEISATLIEKLNKIERIRADVKVCPQRTPAVHQN